MKLTDTQIAALRLLAEGPRETTKKPHGEWIAGSTATALISRGLAKRPKWLGPVEITDAGRHALTKAGP